MTFVNRARVVELLAGLDVRSVHEVDEEGQRTPVPSTGTGSRWSRGPDEGSRDRGGYSPSVRVSCRSW